MKKYSSSVLLMIIGVFAGVVWSKKKNTIKVKQMEMLSNKHLSLFLMMSQWVKIKQNGKSISEYIHKQQIETVAIYGMSYVGECLLNELKNSDIKVKYGIDKNASKIYSDIDIVLPEEELDDVDAIIVTSICFMDEIVELLSKKIACPVVSLEDILYKL